MEVVTKMPTATEATAPNPIWTAPMTAEALPTFLLNDAKDSAVVLGLQNPKQPKYKNNIAMTPYKLSILK